ncbi:MAG: tRNA lysidine(34) synthetase TilS [Candidatus Cloacimonetes bacterium]|nr:tRNA lysidine(34) synthetase TilS [Candidatus Cloacimonadota bacterium]MCF7814449.1 tRNA lysidine(34) synthetase TilS [Candidatus Cloacimonadota bacterium]MCF7869024.1 tRNA lysidine(34) synthetase TilS [Candidatus Cloacimonadota bacterium]MCF7884419.1 tRNA lysidine(34) synthetase TilS [Candidatus Cloacimonadota bacterium]
MKKNLDFFERFEEFASRYKLFKKGEKIVVGFSGGADSTALLLAMWHMKSVFDFSLLAAHVNYNLRGEDSLRDEEFVRNFCFERNISLVIKNVKIKNKSNLESNARDIRFAYFNQLRKLYKVDKIALGHNRKDQAETMLFRMFRGSGYAGIKGISPISKDIIHPILCFSRKEIEKYLNNEGIEWREDKSNRENVFSRNKIRNELLPWLQKNMNPGIVDKLYNTASIFADTDVILEELARRRLIKAQIYHHKNEYKFSLPVILKTRPVLRFYLFRKVFSFLSEDTKDFYTNHFEEIEAILHSKGSKEIELPRNVIVRKEYKELTFLNKDSIKEIDVNKTKEITSLRNRLTFEDTRIIMKKLKKLPTKRNQFEDKNVTYLDYDKTSFPITVRHRQPGDTFVPLGMEHHKKLKDFFIDEKIAKFDRDKVLIFSDNEKILWVAGHRVDNRVIVNDDTKNILMLKIEKMKFKKARAAERIKKK